MLQVARLYEPQFKKRSVRESKTYRKGRQSEAGRCYKNLGAFVDDLSGNDRAHVFRAQRQDASAGFHHRRNGRPPAGRIFADQEVLKARRQIAERIRAKESVKSKVRKVRKV